MLVFYSPFCFETGPFLSSFLLWLENSTHSLRSTVPCHLHHQTSNFWKFNSSNDYFELDWQRKLLIAVDWMWDPRNETPSPLRSCSYCVSGCYWCWVGCSAFALPVYRLPWTLSLFEGIQAKVCCSSIISKWIWQVTREWKTSAIS